MCDRFGAGSVAGTLAPDALDELSGLAASRAHPGVLWAHDDSGGDPALFALSEAGEDLGVYEVVGARNRDWEDIAVGPGPEPGRNYLYIGDIGDNDARRERVTVYRLPEPDAAPAGADGTLEGTETFSVRYPAGPADAESLLVDPLTGDLFVLTKSFGGVAHVLHAAAAALVDGGEVTLTDVGTIAAPSATAADVSPDGAIVVVRTYRSILAFARPAGGSLVDAFGSQSCSAPQISEGQGEAITFAAAGDAYLTASEGPHEPIHRFTVMPVAPTTTSTSTTTPTTARPPADESGSESSKTRSIVAVAAVALAAAAAAGAVTLRRRSR